MNKHDIRTQYRMYIIGYDYAIAQLMKLGFTDYAADQFLFEEA